MTRLKDQFKKQTISFADRVRRVVKAIPKGKVMTYGEVAAAAGSPGAARAVGNVMRNNKDHSLPCHRVIRSDGTIGGYNRIRGGKAKLLREEGAIK